jgi:enoyl-CoA hydratase/carnithine racemase
MTAQDAVTYERRDSVAWITLNRPEQINAVNDAIRNGLIQALAQAEDDGTVRAIVLSGAGPRGFCAGADIKESRGPETPVEARRRMLRNTHFDALQRATKPIIAAIHGICMGGGFEIALACDIRIATADAVFALPETGLGILPGGGGTQRLPRMVGLGRALDLILTGDRIDGQEAFRIGAVSRLVSDGTRLLPEAEKVAQRIAAKPPTATAYAKEAARSGLDVDLASGLQLEKTLFTMLLTTQDRREAANAFREKRKPVFTGK